MRTLSAILLFLASAAVSLGQPVHPQAAAQPVPAVKAAPPKAEPPPGERHLGRAKPLENYDHGAYKAVKGTDGKTRYFPRLAKHVDVGKLAAALPATCDWSEKARDVIARMYANDRLGCCVISSVGHGLGIMTGADTGKGVQCTDAEIMTMYSTWCGPGDNGCNMSVVSDYHQQVGILAAGVRHKSRGTASVDNSNKELVKAAIFFGGGVRIGFNLPSLWHQSANHAIWDVTNSGIVGGHEVYVYGYNATGPLLATWAGDRTMTWAAFLSSRWIDECYMTLTADWYGSDNLAPNGVDVAGLEAAFAAIAGGTVPPLPDPVPPPVPPGPTPVPPGPTPATGDFTTVTTTVYKDGVVVSQKTVLGTSAAAALVQQELKDAVGPKVLLDILKLLADARGKAGNAVLLQDLFDIIRDLGLGEQPPAAPAPREVVIPQPMPANRFPPFPPLGPLPVRPSP